VHSSPSSSSLNKGSFECQEENGWINIFYATFSEQIQLSSHYHCHSSVKKIFLKMKTFLLAAIFLVGLALPFGEAQPGLPFQLSPYGHGYAQRYPYSFGYQYVTGGYGNQYHPFQAPGPQFSIAKVKVEQNPVGYEFSVHESGPNHQKHVHQTASKSVVVAAPAPLVFPQHVIYPHQQQPHIIQHGGYVQPQALHPVVASAIPSSAGPVFNYGYSAPEYANFGGNYLQGQSGYQFPQQAYAYPGSSGHAFARGPQIGFESIY
jgi:hypothetical protein